MDCLYFIKNSDGDSECMKCKSTYSSKSSNSTLQYHLSKAHNLRFDKESSQPSSPIIIQQPQRQQGNLVDMFGKRRKLTKAEDKDLDDAVVQLIFDDMRPFAIVDGSGFKNFCSKMQVQVVHCLYNKQASYISITADSNGRPHFASCHVCGRPTIQP